MIHSAFAGQIYSERLSKTHEHPRRPRVTPAADVAPAAVEQAAPRGFTHWVSSWAGSSFAKLGHNAWT